MTPRSVRTPFLAAGSSLALASTLLLGAIPAQAETMTRLPITHVSLTGTQLSVNFALPNACRWEYQVRFALSADPRPEVLVEAEGRQLDPMEVCTQALVPAARTVTLPVAIVSHVRDYSGRLWWSQPARGFLTWRITTATGGVLVVSPRYAMEPGPISYELIATNKRTREQKRVTGVGPTLTLTGLAVRTNYSLELVARFATSENLVRTEVAARRSIQIRR